MKRDSLHENEHFINGEWSQSQGGKPIDVYEAGTGKVMGAAPDGSIEDLNAAVDAASKAFESWRDLTPQERGEYLRALADGIERRRDELALVVSKEVGATYSLSYNVQVAVPMHSLRTAAEIAENYVYSEEIDNTIVVR